MYNVRLCLLLVAVLPMVLTLTDYCNKTLCAPGEKHIACNNDGSFQDACGTNAHIIPITEEYKHLIINKHNEVRNNVARGYEQLEPAEHMATMKWSLELAKLAEYNVKQCLLKHDECHNTNEFKYSGQNLASTSWIGMEKTVASVIERHIELWFNEYKDCSMKYIRKYSNPIDDKVIGHFTAMVQEKATHIGCAILRHLKSNGFLQQITACNYAYTNIQNRPVYVSGNAASKCKTGVNPNFKYLCSTDEKYDVNS